MGSVRFEKIAESDFDTVLDLADSSFDVDRSVLETDLREVLTSPEVQGYIYGLWDGEVLAGMIVSGQVYVGEWTGEGYISHLAVRREYQRKGLATHMVNRAMADLKSSGARCVCVSIKVGNVPGLTFWKRYGFLLYNDAYESDGYDGPYEGYVKYFKED